MTDLREQEAEFRALARANGKPDDVRIAARTERADGGRARARARALRSTTTARRPCATGGAAGGSGSESHWVEVEQRAVRAAAYAFTEHARLRGRRRTASRSRGRRTATRSPTCSRRSPRSATCPRRSSQPGWIDGAARRRDRRLRQRPARRRHRDLLDHDPLFFNADRGPVRLRPRRRRAGALARVPRRAVGRRRRLDRRAAGVVRLRHLRPARPAQDPAAGRPDPRRQGRDRPHPRRARRPENVAGPTLSSLGRRLRAGAAARQAAGGRSPTPG